MNKGILLGEETKFRKLTLIHYTLPVLRPHSRCASCPNNVEKFQSLGFGIFIKASVPFPKSQERDCDVDAIVAGPLKHLQAGIRHSPDSRRSPGLDMKFRLNLDFPNLSYFTAVRTRKRRWTVKSASWRAELGISSCWWRA